MMMIASLIGGITSAIALNVDSLANAAQGSGMIMTFLILAVVLAVFSYLFQNSIAYAVKPSPRAMGYKPRQLVGYVDGRDTGTPDTWIKRDPSLIRLTGRHPFNCEPPLKDLFDAGFITPTKIHFVRNHGKVPRISWDEHRVTVTGLVKNKTTFTMDQLASLPSYEFPCTFPCAGNRRKEENMVKKGLGFSWGAAAHATSVWKGVRLSTVIKHCGGIADTATKSAKFVCFRGPLKELPKGQDGSYGTSIAIDRAMNDNWDVILAYAQNGLPLSPDHGFPLRIIIPGFIGGRMVKWLSHIEVSDKESTNHFHYYDNRVLPSEVTAERANEEDWWHRPDFIINDINIQSAIRSPEHKEIIHPAPGKKYTVRGYAYGGGGRKVIRCEVSIDQGVTWMAAQIQRFEREWYKKNAKEKCMDNFDSRGKHWCWIHWSIQLETELLCNSSEIRCRAWDSDHNTQPLHIAWNVMGMLNNSSYRLKIHKCEDKDRKEGNGAVWFECPTLAGPQPGGWMVPKDEKVRPQALYASLGGIDPKRIPSKNFSLAQVKEIRNSVTLVIDGNVFDCSSVLKEVPPKGVVIKIGGTTKEQDLQGLSIPLAKLLVEKYQGGKLPCLGSLSSMA
mmetsp:Transcript_4590/g.5687  ORF Transcript_4590/g.5687 Transcript_4590/m.5687 type:complete len:616 (+) Transcript_4590:92-1939(+)|eukprot:jgi/Bigna1/50585/estExt_Genewise1.C_840002